MVKIQLTFHQYWLYNVTIKSGKGEAKMAQWEIIQHLCDMVDNKKIIENEEYKKQKEVTDKWYDQLEEYMKNDKKLYDIFFHFDWEEGMCEGIANQIYFREGFLRGARLALEICGVELFDSKQ